MTSYQATSVAEAMSGNLVCMATRSCRTCAQNSFRKQQNVNPGVGTGPDSRLCTAVHEREVVTLFSVTSVKIVFCMDIVVLVVYFKFKTG